MATIRRKRPRDSVQLAKLIGDIATGQTTDTIDDAGSGGVGAIGWREGREGAGEEIK